jgi:hypothetical protein
MRRRPDGYGEIMKKGRQWYVRIRIESKRKYIKILDPETGFPPETKSQASRLSSIVIAQWAEGKEIIPPKTRKQQIQEGFKLKDAVELFLKDKGPELSEDWKYTVEKYLKNRVIKFASSKKSVGEFRFR